MFAPLILRRPDDDGFVLIEDRVLQVLARHRQLHHGAPESGGILLGFRRGLHLHVTEATAPLASDKASRTRFFRSAAPHQRTAFARWRESGGTMDYLGEWHTHPECSPSPSMIDTRGWERISSTRKAPMLFVIAGTQDRLWIGLGTATGLHTMPELV
jgi:integrative and conjugative element protein (TIGR02256 family)